MSLQCDNLSGELQDQWSSSLCIVFSFELKFDFRTYYKDGVLLYLSNKAQSSFFAVQLKGGAVFLTYENRGNAKEVKIRPSTKVTDGEWHSVVIQKNKKTSDING